MYGLKLRNLASVFVDAQSIVNTSRDVKALLDVLASLELEIDFLPVSVAEAKGEGIPVSRIGFMSQNQAWKLFLLSDRFSLSQDYVGLDADLDSGNVGGLGEFITVATPVLLAVVEHYHRRGHRLAVVQEGFLPSENTKLREIESSLLNLPPTFQSYSPTEWNWRAAAVVERGFGNQNEDTNTIVKVERVQGELSQPQGKRVAFDMIRVDLDINTVPINTVARFGPQEVRDFLEASLLWHENLELELKKFLGIGG